MIEGLWRNADLVATYADRDFWLSEWFAFLAGFSTDFRIWFWVRTILTFFTTVDRDGAFDDAVVVDDFRIAFDVALDVIWGF